MQRVLMVLASLGLVLSFTAAGAATPDKAGNVAHGKQLYLATGCYECHGTRGQGGGTAGPRLAPLPIPFPAFVLQLRNPRARMPVYTAAVMSDSDVQDIQAYLQSIPQAKPVAGIPLLNQ